MAIEVTNIRKLRGDDDLPTVESLKRTISNILATGQLGEMWRDDLAAGTRTPEQRVNFDTGQPRIDKATGQPLWQVQVMALDESGGDVIAVSVAGEPNVSAVFGVEPDEFFSVPTETRSRGQSCAPSTTDESYAGTNRAVLRPPSGPWLRYRGESCSKTKES